jgi:acetolactate decarboxylase
VNPVHADDDLVDAAKKQSEFHFTDIVGTLVGLWSPGFSSAFSVPGYHFHFLSADRQHGGHLLDCSAGTLYLQIDALTEFHLALPETESFLKADLNKSTTDELAYGERGGE